MTLFSFLRHLRRTPAQSWDDDASVLAPAAILRQVQAYVPEYYKHHDEYQQSCAYLANQQPGPALTSLIAAALQSGHYFFNEFWQQLAVCADKLDLPGPAQTCQQQLARNARELAHQPVKGWTIEKTPDGGWGTRPAQIIEDAWNAKQFKRDGLPRLIRKAGFHDKTYGRGGTLYYVEAGRALIIGYELSGAKDYDWLINLDFVTHWTYPERQCLAAEEKAAVREKLLTWLARQRIKADIQEGTFPDWATRP